MKTFSQFLLEATDPKGPIKKYMSPEEIAKKHKLSLNTINSQLEMGIKVESEHTGSKQMARMIALQHLEELPDYYTRLKKAEKIKEERKSGDYSLRDWFSKSKSSDGKPGWVQLGGPYAGKPCARQPGQTSTPKCGSSKMAANLSDEEEERAFRRKNRKDPNQPEKSGGAKPTNVATEETIIEKKDACYNKVKSRYRVWPSAYASGALVKCRKVGAKNWGNKTEALNYDWDTPIRERPDRYCPKCERLELRTECEFGARYWDMFSLPAELIASKKEYNIIMPYAGNVKEKHEFSNWREDFSPVEYEFTDIIAADPIKTLKNPLIQEDITSLNSRGATYLVFLLWRGQNISVQMFFPQIKRPTKNDVEFEIKKIYPLAKVLKFEPIKIDTSKALIFTGEQK